MGKSAAAHSRITLYKVLRGAAMVSGPLQFSLRTLRFSDLRGLVLVALGLWEAAPPRDRRRVWISFTLSA